MSNIPPPKSIILGMYKKKPSRSTIVKNPVTLNTINNAMTAKSNFMVRFTMKPLSSPMRNGATKGTKGSRISAISSIKFESPFSMID